MFITVCICTFRRRSVVRTISSINEQLVDIPGIRFGLLVVDNDDTPSSEAVVAQAFAGARMPCEYIHAPGRNISIARNAAMTAARVKGDWAAFIDDDEYAERGWLAALVTVAEAENADVVFGPVKAVYGPAAPKWIRTGDFHSHRYLANRRVLRDGYTSNVLIRLTSSATKGQLFLESFGRSGGEDTEFFRRLYLRGAAMRFAKDAVVYETVEPVRQTLRWLTRRSFRAGAAYGRARQLHQPERVRAVAVAAETSKVVWSTLAGGLNAWRQDRALSWFFRASFHAGALIYLLGLSVPDSYGGEPASGSPAHASQDTLA